jgi:hypothetical protein
VVNAQCSLLFRGSAYTEGNTGFSDGGFGVLIGRATLQPYEWWNQPPTIPAAHEIEFLNISAFGQWFAPAAWSLESGEDTWVDVWREVDLRYELFAIPPNGVAVFEVTVSFEYILENGEIWFDFATSPHYSIICPFLRLDQLPVTTTHELG